MLNGRSILVTGGTGSFGQAFVREVLRRHRPERMVVFSRDELRQQEMAQVLRQEDHPALRYVVGDVRDLDRLQRSMKGVDYVVHAAAMKQIAIAELNPLECIRTNVYGSQNVIDAALDTGVKRVVALSSDKASNPINLYGATKLAADKCLVAANHLAGASGTRFSVVRYGNVVETRGGVVERFRQLIAAGARELPITDKRMTRFWITLKQSVDFVLDRLEAMVGGEIFIPKLPTMRIVDLARSMAPHCDLVVVGIRPGEKLHEVLLPRDEARAALEFERHFTVQPAFNWWHENAHRLEGGALGKAVPEDFEYASNTNADRVACEEIGRLMRV